MFGDKITFSIAPGVRFPGIIVSEPENSVTEVPSRNRPGQMARFPASHAWVISLRTTNPVAPDGSAQEVTTFYRKSRENLNFAIPRETLVDGLDVDMETGEKLSIAQLGERVLDSLDARQIARQTAGALSVDELSLDELDALTAPGA